MPGDFDFDDDDERPRRRRRRSRFRCPYCDTPAPPDIVTKVSAGGWVVFVVLLFVFFPLCWLGLLMKEEYRVCQDCGVKVGG